jgi:hypothetical protein
MTPKEKAIELVDKFKLSFAGVISADENWEDLSKQCALIAINLLIAEMYAYDSCYCDNYYFKVKKEIEEL